MLHCLDCTVVRPQQRILNAFALLRIIETKIFYVMFHKSELALLALLFNTLCFLAYFVSRTEIHASPPCLPLIPGSHLQQIRLERLPGYNEQILFHRTHYLMRVLKS